MMNKTETYDQKKRRLFGRQYLESYLKELDAITNKKINEEMLLSLVESDEINSTVFTESRTTLIDFHDKEKLLLLLGDLAKLRNGEIYLYTSYSEDCGMLQLDSLMDFNVNFDFEDEHSGLITITLKDLSNKLILDFYEEGNDQLLTVEVYGADWTKVEFER